MANQLLFKVTNISYGYIYKHLKFFMNKTIQLEIMGFYLINSHLELLI